MDNLLRNLSIKAFVRLEPNLQQLNSKEVSGGAKQDRTADLLNANQALSQLSYSP